ncbi:unnamed protein product [Adineta ricciae]|uniref:SUEL-type lectin domain-containing protein n=1 Tax=Adineta ricciae TaxID=249248 RepID=A0A815KZD7_ADIRI|nr:unnamed protein product [Adineta ricciae]
MLFGTIVSILFIIEISTSSNTNLTPYTCIEPTDKPSSNLPSCLPGYIIHIENVMYESTTDDTCSGTARCRIENKNTLLFACNRKRTCSINITDLRFSINSTCGSTRRVYTTYRCLPVIYDQTDFLCESSAGRRVTSGDINLSCARNYRLYIKTALAGISLRQQADQTGNRFKCNRDTPTICTTPTQNDYRYICDNQLKQGNGAECKIRYNERPLLRDCPYGTVSNFSMVEYSCIPSDKVTDELPRFDICSAAVPERLTHDRGLLHSPNYPQTSGQHLTCKKQLYVSRQSRLRLYMLENSLEYSHELSIRLLNSIQILNVNELIDVNTSKRHDELVEFQLKTNHFDGARFLLYFQVDSYLSEYAPYNLEADGKMSLKRQWGIAIGCILGVLFVLLIIAAIFGFIRTAKRRRRERSSKYLKSEENHHEHLNSSKTSPASNHHHGRNLQTEQPYLISSSPAILPLTSGNVANRPHSASSTTSSTIIHQPNDGVSDLESLIKPVNADIDNLYEEIKEQQHQTALALAIQNGAKGESSNPYLEAKTFEQKQSTLQDSRSSQPIRDHHEVFYYECE